MNSILQLVPFFAFLAAGVVAVLALVEFGHWSALRRQRLHLRPRLARFRGRGVDVVAGDTDPTRRPVQVLRRQRPVVYCERAL